jgi:hypothetical protein
VCSSVGKNKCLIPSGAAGFPKKLHSQKNKTKKRRSKPLDPFIREARLIRTVDPHIRRTRRERAQGEKEGVSAPARRLTAHAPCRRPSAGPQAKREPRMEPSRACCPGRGPSPLLQSALAARRTPAVARGAGAAYRQQLHLKFEGCVRWNHRAGTPLTIVSVIHFHNQGIGTLPPVGGFPSGRCPPQTWHWCPRTRPCRRSSWSAQRGRRRWASRRRPP